MRGEIAGEVAFRSWIFARKKEDKRLVEVSHLENAGNSKNPNYNHTTVRLAVFLLELNHRDVFTQVLHLTVKT